MPSLHLRLLGLARRGSALPPRERLHALRALAWMLALRFLLGVLPYASMRRLIDRLPARRARMALAPADCARAVARAARLLPRTTCLIRALTAECLLRRDGLAATLSLGVVLDEARGLHAHAWLESQGIAVTGGDEAAGYGRLAPPSRP